MAFSNITALQTFVNTYIDTNSTNSITGLELNDAFNGIIQFLPTVGTYTESVSASGRTIITFTIPLDFTPVSTSVQSNYPASTSSGPFLYDGITIVSSMPTTNGIIVYCLIGTSPLIDDIVFTYLAL